MFVGHSVTSQYRYMLGNSQWYLHTQQMKYLIFLYNENIQNLFF